LATPKILSKQTIIWQRRFLHTLFFSSDNSFEQSDLASEASPRHYIAIILALEVVVNRPRRPRAIWHPLTLRDQPPMQGVCDG
jgi:hypothetical protein